MGKDKDSSTELNTKKFNFVSNIHKPGKTKTKEISKFGLYES